MLAPVTDYCGSEDVEAMQRAVILMTNRYAQEQGSVLLAKDGRIGQGF
jgi:hypothetical protein